MAVEFRLVRSLVLFLVLFSVWKAPLSPKPDIGSFYTPLMLAGKINILYAGDVHLSLNQGVELASLLAGFGFLTCLLGLQRLVRR